jgi:hypothetical protein
MIRRSIFWTGANGKTLFEELGPDLKDAERRDLSRDDAVVTSVFVPWN